MSQIFQAQAWEEKAQSPESGNIFLFEIGQCFTGDLVEWTVNSFKMNHLISQEWQEIMLRHFLHMIFDARAFECDTFWICWGFQKFTIACSFLVKNERDNLSLWKNSRFIAFESPCIKEHMYKISKPYTLSACHSWAIRWFIFNELTVHSTRSPVKYCPISKRRIFPDSGDWALSSQACARKIWYIRAHPIDSLSQVQTRSVLWVYHCTKTLTLPHVDTARHTFTILNIPCDLLIDHTPPLELWWGRKNVLDLGARVVLNQ
jgi:hypothetical protein